jgi:hypothetical protein
VPLAKGWQFIALELGPPVWVMRSPIVDAVGGVLRVEVGGGDADVIAPGAAELGLHGGDEAGEALHEALLLVGHAAGVVDHEQDVDARAALAGGGGGGIGGDVELEAGVGGIAGVARAGRDPRWCSRGSCSRRRWSVWWRW